MWDNEEILGQLVRNTGMNTNTSIRIPSIRLTPTHSVTPTCQTPARKHDRWSHFVLPSRCSPSQSRLSGDHYKDDDDDSDDHCD